MEKVDELGKKLDQKVGIEKNNRKIKIARKKNKEVIKVVEKIKKMRVKVL